MGGARPPEWTRSPMEWTPSPTEWGGGSRVAVKPGWGRHGMGRGVKLSQVSDTPIVV